MSPYIVKSNFVRINSSIGQGNVAKVGIIVGFKIISQSLSVGAAGVGGKGIFSFFGFYTALRHRNTVHYMEETIDFIFIINFVGSVIFKENCPYKTGCGRKISGQSHRTQATAEFIQSHIWT